MNSSQDPEAGSALRAAGVTRPAEQRGGGREARTGAYVTRRAPDRDTALGQIVIAQVSGQHPREGTPPHAWAKPTAALCFCLHSLVRALPSLQGSAEPRTHGPLVHVAPSMV